VLERAVRRQLEALDHGRKHRIELAFGNAVLRATVIPASTYRESIVSMDLSGGVRYSPGVADVRNDIKAKTAKYRGLKRARIPFILAIGAETPLIDWESVFVALYGDEQVTITLHDGDVVAIDGGSLDHSGHVTPKPGRRAVDTTLSAVWSVRWALRDSEMYAEVVHLPNPWAANPIRIPGRDITRVSWRRDRVGRVAIRKPRRLRWIKVS
jgi:hypothetical protein